MEKNQCVPNLKVLGVNVDAIQIPEVISHMKDWIQNRDNGRYITVTGMHGVMEAQSDASFKNVLNAASLVVPDGMPLVWLLRRNGHSTVKRRVYGPELMETFCRETGSEYRHYFYGGARDVPERLAQTLHRKFGLHVAGTYSPPFRSLTQVEDDDVLERINQARPDVLWVGIGCPKQERWMFEHKDQLHVPVIVGVGAAFDFLAGLKPSAPRWMQENGLEWLFRLSSEPRRLWHRYLVYGSKFVFYVFLEQAALKRFD
ncbi:MAG TPA: glycosyltransferase [Nitrospinaceae bacterium]|nr:glycosyltransferase [Nitrospinaceae bacterium]